MPLIPMPSVTRVSLLVCDACDGVMTRDGTHAPKKHRDSSPDDLAPHYDHAVELVNTARSSGWRAKDDRWHCGACADPT